MPENRGKYSLDELLRAKRREHPEPEFWTSFERELKSKQRLLIQKQLASDTRLKSPAAARFFKFGALTATCGLAAFAVVLGLRTSDSESPTIVSGNSSVASPAVATVAPSAAPSFTVANDQADFERSTPVALQEFATFAQSATPRVIIERRPVAAKTPTASQISAIETLTQLEKTIRANRNTAKANRYQFVSSSGLFELSSDAGAVEETVAEKLSSFEQAYLLGKYADPLHRNIEPADTRNRVQGELGSVSFSQLEQALSMQGSSHRDRSFDALTVRF